MLGKQSNAELTPTPLHVLRQGLVHVPPKRVILLPHSIFQILGLNLSLAQLEF